MSKPTVRVLIGATWVASVAAAYFIGQSGNPTSPGPQTTGAGNSNSGSAANKSSGGDRRAGHAIETYDGSGIAESANPPGKMNVPDLIARARMEMATGMNGMMNMRGMLRAIAPLAELDDSQVQEALAEVESTIKDPQQKMMFYSLLLSQWAEKDGPAAFAYAEEKLKGKGPFDGGAKMAVIGAWARQDPDAVWKWFTTRKEKNAFDPSNQMTISSVFAGMASRDLDMAFTRLNTLDDQERSMALSGITNSSRDARSRERLLSRADSLSPELRRQLQDNVARTWAMTDADAAMKWVRARPAEEQTSLRSAVGSTLMMSDPERGAAFQIEGVAEKDRSRVYDSVVGNWAWRDPRGAGEWLTKQTQGPELDAARRTFASVVSQRDPAAAMDWAKSVTDDEQRTSSVRQVYSQWKSKDSKAANAALDAAGLSAEQIEKIRGVNQPAAVK